MPKVVNIEQLVQLLDQHRLACENVRNGFDHQTHKRVRQLALDAMVKYKQNSLSIRVELNKWISSSAPHNTQNKKATKVLQKSQHKLLIAEEKLKKELLFVDLRDKVKDPVKALYQSGNHTVLVDIPLLKLRNLAPLSFPLTTNSCDPYIKSTQDYLKGDCTSYENSWLEWFYTKWNPRNAAAVLGLFDEEAPAALVECAPYAYVYPWGTDNPYQRQKIGPDLIRNENILKGADIPGIEGSVYFGPFSKRKGELEFSRICYLADSIIKNGYQINKSTTHGELMVRGDDWCIGRGGGNHRRAVLAALGYSQMPMRVKWTINRDDVNNWPNVINGLFNVNQALNIFDRIFEGRQPSGCPSTSA